MNSNTLRIAILLFIFSISIRVSGSHLVGVDFEYQSIDSNRYIVTCNVYRDCGSAGTSNIMPVQISSSCNQPTTFTVNLPLVSQTTQNLPECNSVITTCAGGLALGIEKDIFQDTITLPFACIDWNVSIYQFGRSSLVTTYGGGGNLNLVAHCVINNQDVVSNHSPVFINPYSIPVLYTGQQQCYSFLTYDSDGDSLVYDLVEPGTGNFQGDTLYYDALHSHLAPIYSSTPNTLNNATGEFCCMPLQNEVSTIAVHVGEFRNGVLIGQTIRDIIIVTTASSNNRPALTGFDGNSTFTYLACPGITLNPFIASTDADATDTTTISLMGPMLPFITFTQSNNYRDSVFLSITPTLSDVSSNFYYFYLNVGDDACPYSGQSQSYYSVYVLPPTNGYCLAQSTDQVSLEKNFSVYPNPAENFVNIKSDIDEKIRLVELIDASGRIIKTEKIDFLTHFRYNLSGLAAGLYYLHLKSVKSEAFLRLSKN